MKQILYLFLLLFFFQTGEAAEKLNPFIPIDNLGFTRTFLDSPDLELPDLQGKKSSLRDYQGKWVVLAFWATWCGPCRTELPELENLHKYFRQKNLVILGISTDQAATSVIRKFVEELNVTFPVLHDEGGQVAADYQATALPSLYLISPEQKLVGIVRGAKSWSDDETFKQFENLLKLKKISENDFKKDNLNPSVNPSGPLPEKLIPPVLEVSKLDLVTEDTNAVLQVKIHWKGDPNKYRVKVPKIIFPDGVILKDNISSGSQADEKEAVLYYSYPLLFKKEGMFHLGPVTMSFQSIYGGSEQLTQHPGIDVDVKSRPKVFLYGSLAFFIGMIILYFGILVFRKKQKTKILPSSEKVDWIEALQGIKKLRIEGRKKEYSLELLKLNMKIQNAKGENPNSKKISELFEQVRFAGFELSEAELDYYEKEIGQQI